MSGVKAGIMLSAQYFEGADMVSALEEQIEMVRLARDRGWDSYFCGQHYLNGRQPGAADGAAPENRRCRLRSRRRRKSPHAFRYSAKSWLR